MEHKPLTAVAVVLRLNRTWLDEHGEWNTDDGEVIRTATYKHGTLSGQKSMAIRRAQNMLARAEVSDDFYFDCYLTAYEYDVRDHEWYPIEFATKNQGDASSFTWHRYS